MCNNRDCHDGDNCFCNFLDGIGDLLCNEYFWIVILIILLFTCWCGGDKGCRREMDCGCGPRVCD